MKQLLFLIMISLFFSAALRSQSPAPAVQTTADEATMLKASILLTRLQEYSTSFDGSFTEIKVEKKETYKDGTETFSIIKLEKDLQRSHQLQAGYETLVLR